MRTPEDAAQVADRLAEVRARIAQAARRAGRSADEIKLVGASKRQSPERIAAAVAAGLRDLGENYVQEARDKREQVEHLLPPDCPPPRWRMIGHLQRNKANLAVSLFDVVESVDDLRLAQALDSRAAAAGRALDIFVQVDLSGESSKSGAAPAHLADLLRGCADLSSLHVRGLMAIPAPAEDPEQSRGAFARLRALRDSLAEGRGGEELRELSMGMSGDYEVAIEEGATVVRVGTALFGPRPAPPADNTG